MLIIYLFIKQLYILPDVSLAWSKVWTFHCSLCTGMASAQYEEFGAQTDCWRQRRSWSNTHICMASPRYEFCCVSSISYCLRKFCHRDYTWIYPWRSVTAGVVWDISAERMLCYRWSRCKASVQREPSLYEGPGFLHFYTSFHSNYTSAGGWLSHQVEEVWQRSPSH